MKLHAVAYFEEQDDFLFLEELENGNYGRVAFVHLTWKAETNPSWPHSGLFPTLQAWLDQLSTSGPR